MTFQKGLFGPGADDESATGAPDGPFWWFSGHCGVPFSPPITDCR